MLFNSFQFLVFFPVVICAYFILPHKHRWILLLASSYIFYMAWKPAYIVLIILSTVVDYYASLWMGKEKEKRKRKKYLTLSLLFNLGLLFTFKYFNFFNTTMSDLFAHTNFYYPIQNTSLLLPIGISFYTFQTLSYTIDVYRNKRAPEKHFGYFALYVSFFPQLVAGPIERSDRLIKQFYKPQTFNYNNVTDGLKRMAWGFFKKVVIADRLAILVNTVYNQPSDYQGFQLILATVLFGFQIFCDFSGYSDIAIGAAKVMGINLMENFKRPYFSKSISEFWSRWHISLSTWFRDYLYVPLGGNRVPVPRHYLNLAITFLISGLWHGANWTFIIWGALHSLYIIVEHLLTPIKNSIEQYRAFSRYGKIYNFVRMLVTFSLVTFAWIFFRANTVGDAFYIVRNVFAPSGAFISFASFQDKVLSLGLNGPQLVIALVSILIMGCVHMIQREGSVITFVRQQKLILRWILYYALIVYILLFAITAPSQFIYFQF